MNQVTALLVLGLTLAITTAVALAPMVNEMAFAAAAGGGGGGGGGGRILP